MIKVKHGKCHMKGDKNRIFTDTVHAVDTFCSVLAETEANANKTKLLACTILAVLETKEGYDVKELTHIIKHFAKGRKADASTD